MSQDWRVLYKILHAAAWRAATDTVPWAPVDEADGFFHLSSREQVEETARKHFAGREGLVLLAIDPQKLTEGTLKWEPSRGGQLFPHVYGAVPKGAVVEVRELPRVTEAFRLS